MKQLIAVLSSFDEPMKVLQQDKAPTIHLVAYYWKRLEKQIEEIDEIESFPEMRRLKEMLLKNMKLKSPVHSLHLVAALRFCAGRRQADRSPCQEHRTNHA